MAVTWQQVSELGRRLPEVVEEVWYRTPALKVRGKGFVRLIEDGRTLVFLVESVEEQEFLIQAQPRIFYITDHYRGYPAVLARMKTLGVRACVEKLERAYCIKAPKKLREGLGALPRKGRP